MNEFVSETSLDWPRDARKDDDYYVNEEGTYEIVFSIQHPKAKNTAAMCCFFMFDSSLQTKYGKNINKPLKEKTIKYKPINRKFYSLMMKLMISKKTGT